MPVLLVVEDQVLAAQMLQAQLTGCGCPRDRYAFVQDAENATKALLGQEFTEFFPETEACEGSPKRDFVAVIWDNTFPEHPSENPLENMGLKVIEAVKGRVDEIVRSHFLIHSAETPSRFRERGLEVSPKPMPLKVLKEHIDKWGLSEAPTSAASPSVAGSSRGSPETVRGCEAFLSDCPQTEQLRRF